MELKSSSDTGIFKILSLDGGGGKGMYTLGVLREIESLLRKPLNQHFNLFYGTSTGSIIASALAKGAKVQEIVDFYEKSLPKIMTTYLSKRRSSALNDSLNEFFKNQNFSELKNIGLGVVATNLIEKKPLIFKTLPQMAHGLKHSFIPGFGIELKHAIHASCSAIPFFEPKSLQLENASNIQAIDGGFVANNPSLYALIDARKALGVDDKNIRLISIGTGTYPEKYPIYSYLNAFHLKPALKTISMQFAANSNSIEGIFKLLATTVPYCRINETFADPELTTSLFEHRKVILNRLFGKGRDSFGRLEQEINNILTK